MDTEKINKPTSGYPMIALFLIFLIGGILGLAVARMPLSAIFVVLAIMMTPGFFFVNPNESRVLTQFGEYNCTVNKNCFFFVKTL
ncbi:MAG: SPFH domain-containing protein, partial [Imperialibacter sp.]